MKHPPNGQISHQLPLLPGLDQIDVMKFRTRASKSNREYVEPHLKIEGTPNALQLEAVFDAQTSGGLLISVPTAKVRDLSSKHPRAVIIGDVVAERDCSLLLTP